MPKFAAADGAPTRTVIRPGLRSDMDEPPPPPPPDNEPSGNIVALSPTRSVRRIPLAAANLHVEGTTTYDENDRVAFPAGQIGGGAAAPPPPSAEEAQLAQLKAMLAAHAERTRALPPLPAQSASCRRN